MMIILIVLIVYILSAILARLFFSKAYFHEKGVWKNISPDGDDIIMVFLPVANTVVAIQYIFGGWKHQKYRKSEWINKFFK